MTPPFPIVLVVVVVVGGGPVHSKEIEYEHEHEDDNEHEHESTITIENPCLRSEGGSPIFRLFVPPIPFRSSGTISCPQEYMSNIVLVGAQWGDEGKGKVIDYLTDNVDVVVRSQGGTTRATRLLLAKINTSCA